jgi:UDP-glucuronate decarboxylase
MSNNNPIENQILIDDFNGVINKIGKKINRFNNKRILITGSSGMLGSYYALFFIYLKEKIGIHLSLLLTTTSVNRLSRKLGFFLSKDYIEVLNSDLLIIRDFDLNDINFVIHAASLASPHYYRTNPLDTILPNILGTYNLLDKLSSYNNLVSFLFISSNSAYGLPSNNLVTELDDSVFNFNDIGYYYGISKLVGDVIGKSYSMQKNVAFNSIRLSHTLGPGLDYQQDTRVFSQMINNIINHEPISIKTPNAMRVFTYSSDVLFGSVLILLSELSGEVFNLSNTNNLIRIDDLANVLSIKYGLPVRRLEDNNSLYVESAVIQSPQYSSKKIEQLGYYSSVSLLEVFNRTIAYIKQEDNRNEQTS